MTVKRGKLRYYTLLTPEKNDRGITREEARERLKTSYIDDQVDEVIDNRHPFQLRLRDGSIVYTATELEGEKWGQRVPAPGLFTVWDDESIVED